MIKPTLRYWQLTLLCMALLLGACSLQQAREAEEPDAVVAVRKLEAAGRFAEAAKQYLALASKAESEDQHLYKLMAADAFVSANDFKHARDVLATMPKLGKDETIAIAWSQVINTHLALRQRQAKAALTTLPTSNSNLPRELRVRIGRTRAEAYAANGMPLDEAKAWWSVLPDTSATVYTATTRKLWQALNAMPLEQLRELMPPTPDDFGGWLELGYLNQQYRWQYADLEREIAKWQQRYPKHSASGLVTQVLQDAEQLSRMPTRIAVMLPLSGKLADAGNAIRDGMIAAHVHTDRLGPRPEFRFYDVANAAKLDSTLQLAIKDGAQFAIGPLDKAAVDSLARRATLPIPMMALNYASPTQKPPANMYQFGLLPEDEAIAAARYAHRKGLSRPVVLVPNSALGQRLQKAFTAEWKRIGGQLAGEARYSQDTKDFAATLQLVTKAQPDFVFLVAFPGPGRLINSQLRAMTGGNIRVIASSQIYGGLPNAKQDADLEGVTVGDCPWIIDDSAALGDAQRLLAQKQPNLFRQYGRLNALGIDAYNVISYLALLRGGQQSNILGASGLLTIDPTGQVHRDVAWAEFHDGVPQLIDHAGE